MSLSPTPESSSEEITAYDIGWAATNKLIRAGRSFSGHERNACFLNLGGGRRFANVSAPTGLDFADDGRGLAVADWDHDGRPDFWTTNRTGPRLRFLHNRVANGNHWVAVRLAGTTDTVNRDAIGARVTVWPTGQPLPVARTLRAGAGFLSQDSKWLHFGLGRAESIDRIVVRWPGGGEEVFEAPAVSRSYRLVEGTGAALPEERTPVDTSGWGEAPPVAESAEPSTRTILLVPTPLPDDLAFIDSEGTEQRLDGPRDRPLLVHLWATWCPNCREEMDAWTADRGTLADAGIDVLALSVDEPTADRAADLEKAAAAARARGFPFPVGLASLALVENLNILQRACIGRQNDLPLPSSFLVDPAGQVAAIYKGPVSAARIAMDAPMLGADPATILRHATPFPGRWMEPPSGTSPRSFAVALVEHGLLEEAGRFLERIVPRYLGPVADPFLPDDERRTDELFECHKFLGAIRFDQGDFEAAAARYRAALAIVPTATATRRELVRTLEALGRAPEAAGELERILADRPDDPEVLADLARARARLDDLEAAVGLFQQSLASRDDPAVHDELATALRKAGRAGEAVSHYRAALAADPRALLPANNLAWILATHPDDAVRDGDEALRWAERANELAGARIPPVLGTLAAAQAESGRFREAVASIEAAVRLAGERGDEALAARLREKRELYARDQPFRDESLTRDDP